MVEMPEIPELPALFMKKNEPKTKVSTKDSTTYLYKCFRIMGLYPTDKNRFLYALWMIFIHFWVTIFLPSSFIASYSLKSSQNIEYDVLLTSIQVVIDVIGSSGKIVMLLYYIPHLKTTEPVMAQLDERCTDDDEIKLLQKLKVLGNSLVVNFAICFWSYATSTFIVSIFAGHPPYSLYLPYINWRNSKEEFIIASVIEWMLMDGACFQQVANDAYASVYVCILRAHVNILRLRISKLNSNPNKTLEENEKELKLCIKDHKKIIELYNIIAPVISATIFLQFTITAVILSITLINILIFAKNVSAKVASCFYVMAVVTEIFPLCYYSNCLIYDSDRLSEDIFHSKWVDQNSRYRKMMIFFMQRTQQTMELLAGKIFPINLNSFISKSLTRPFLLSLLIAKFSMSLYTLIKKMNLKERLGLQ